MRFIVHWILYQFGIICGLYYLYGGLFLLLDITKKPSFLYTRYKIQSSVDFDAKKNVERLFINVTFNMFCIVLPSAVVLTFLVQHVEKDLTQLTLWEHRPPLVHALAQLLVIILIAEFSFYFVHRLLHVRFFFEKVHYVHHRMHTPVAFSALYAHPLEVLFGNVVPLALGVAVLRPHIVVSCCWYALAVLGTCTDHCGYRLPWTPRWSIQPNNHDFHHRSRGVANFSFLGLADRLFGTLHV